jgi:hypothetical protein
VLLWVPGATQQAVEPRRRVRASIVVAAAAVSVA